MLLKSLREPTIIENQSEKEIGGGVIWVFPKIRGTFLGVPIIRTIAFWGLYWGPPTLGNYHISVIQGRLRTLKCDNVVRKHAFVYFMYP